ncbi:MAG: hypothetical protein ACR2M6_02390 [Vampirovibrionia bacterium]
MMLSMCQSKANLQRQTSLLKDSTTVVASFSLDRSPTRRTCLLFTFGTSVSGQITITGSLSGTPTTETLNISSSTFKNSIKSFDTVTLVEFDSTLVSSGTSFDIKSVGRNGIEQSMLTTVVSEYPAQFVRQRPSSTAFDVKKSGSVERNMPYVIFPYTSSFTPRDTDIVTNVTTNEKFFVVGDPLEEHYGMMKHYMVKLQRKEQ